MTFRALNRIRDTKTDAAQGRPLSAKLPTQNSLIRIRSLGGAFEALRTNPFGYSEDPH